MQRSVPAAHFDLAASSGVWIIESSYTDTVARKRRCSTSCNYPDYTTVRLNSCSDWRLSSLTFDTKLLDSCGAFSNAALPMKSPLSWSMNFPKPQVLSDQVCIVMWFGINLPTIGVASMCHYQFLPCKTNMCYTEIAKWLRHTATIGCLQNFKRYWVPVLKVGPC